MFDRPTDLETLFSRSGIRPGKTHLFILDSCFLINLGRSGSHSPMPKEAGDGRLLELIDTVARMPNCWVIIPTAVEQECTANYHYIENGELKYKNIDERRADAPISYFIDTAELAVICDGRTGAAGENYFAYERRGNSGILVERLSANNVGRKMLLLDTESFRQITCELELASLHGPHALAEYCRNGNLSQSGDLQIGELADCFAGWKKGRFASINVLSDDLGVKRDIIGAMQGRAYCQDTFTFLRAMLAAGYDFGNAADPKSAAYVIKDLDLSDREGDHWGGRERFFTILRENMPLVPKLAESNGCRFSRNRDLEITISEIVGGVEQQRTVSIPVHSRPSAMGTATITTYEIGALKRQARQSYEHGGDTESVPAWADRITDDKPHRQEIAVTPLGCFREHKLNFKDLRARMEVLRDEMPWGCADRPEILPRQEDLGRFCGGSADALMACDPVRLQESKPLLMLAITDVLLEREGIRRRPEKLPHSVRNPLSAIEQSYDERLALLRQLQEMSGQALAV